MPADDLIARARELGAPMLAPEPAIARRSALLLALADRVEALEQAIRKHRDERGDDRCWLDDSNLYLALDDGAEFAEVTTLPPKCDFLMSCARFWEQRQRPSEKDCQVAGRMTLAQIEARVEALEGLIRECEWRGWSATMKLPACPSCYGLSCEGHAPGCRLARALGHQPTEASDA